MLTDIDMQVAVHAPKRVRLGKNAELTLSKYAPGD